MAIGFIIFTSIVCILLFMQNVYYYHKIQNSIDLILTYESIDGSHHKQWVLSTLLKMLVSEKEYQELIKHGLNEGVAP